MKLEIMRVTMAHFANFLFDKFIGLIKTDKNKTIAEKIQNIMEKVLVTWFLAAMISITNLIIEYKANIQTNIVITFIIVLNCTFLEKHLYSSSQPSSPNPFVFNPVTFLFVFKSFTCSLYFN